MFHAPDLTRNQELVFQALSKAKSPLTAYALLARLEHSGLRAPLQVYRALDRLVARGLVHRLESINAFVACDGSHAKEQAPAGFTICVKCGRAEEFCDPRLGSALKRIADSSDFSAEKYTIEISGLCESCRSAQDQAHGGPVS